MSDTEFSDCRKDYLDQADKLKAIQSRFQQLTELSNCIDYLFSIKLFFLIGNKESTLKDEGS